MLVCSGDNLFEDPRNEMHVALAVDVIRLYPVPEQSTQLRLQFNSDLIEEILSLLNGNCTPQRHEAPAKKSIFTDEQWNSLRIAHRLSRSQREMQPDAQLAILANARIHCVLVERSCHCEARARDNSLAV